MNTASKGPLESGLSVAVTAILETMDAYAPRSEIVRLRLERFAGELQELIADEQLGLIGLPPEFQVRDE